MPARRPPDPAYRAVIFDLDETLIDSRPAWRYTFEETLMSVCNRRIDAQPLVDEYHRRPWRDSLAIVLDEPQDRRHGQELCERIAVRSAMKRLLVFEGVGMALDEIRAARIEIGAVSRLSHAIALKQAQATGLDRFLTVLLATPAGERWDPHARAAECLAWLARPPRECLFVGAEPRDLEAMRAAAMDTVRATWAPVAGGSGGGLSTPAAVAGALLRGVDERGLPLGADGG